jgi:uncharacterized membrane protein (DUF4010 family)
MQIEEFFVRALISLGIGALIGVEREFSKKQTVIGIRTLALASLLGMLSSYFELPLLIPIGFIVVAGYGVLSYIKQKKKVFGLTTLFSLLLSYIFGILVGSGYIIESVGIAIITTLLLFIRAETRIFVKKLKREEIFEALEFGILLFILYPILPESISLFGFTLNLKMALQIIIIISLISLLTFLVLIFYGEHMLPIIGLIGGMINSFGTITNFVNKKKVETSSILLAEAGKMVSAIILSFLIIEFQNKLFFGCAVMGIVLVFFAILNHKKLPYKKLRLHQPFSLKEGIKIGLYILVAFLLSQLFSNFQYGLYLTSLLIGMFSTNAIIATSALDLSNKSITISEASTMIFLSLLSGLIVDALLTRKTKVFKKVSVFTLLAILFGILAFLLIGA